VTTYPVRRDDLERTRVVVVPFLTPGVSGMTLGRYVLLRRDRTADVGLLAHELVHVQQWREMGALRFLGRYLGDYLRGRLRGLGHWDAYRAISLEADARAATSALLGADTYT